MVKKSFFVNLKKMSQKETKTKNDSNTQKQTNLNQKPPPDGGYGWVILGGAFVRNFTLKI